MHYIFKPNKEIKSGKIIATLEVKDTQGVYTNIDEVDLILEFEQSHEMNKNVVERTTYTYAAGAGYTDAVAAYDEDMPDILTRLKAIASTKYRTVIPTYGIPIKTAITVLRTELLRSGVNCMWVPTANTV